MARKVHFIGIGGVGMAALAVLEKSAGADVSGCDLHQTPRTRWLESLGIPVATGHDPAHVSDADEIVATPAVAAGNPELAACKGKPVRMRGEVLAGIVSSRETIAVCGTHGKTTTSTFIARLLLALGEDVAWAIGGETRDFPVAGCGKGVLVVEADESDGTLALYKSSTLVVTNCEYDHPDHFKTFADYAACFDAARANAKTVIEAQDLSVEDMFTLGGFDFARALAPHNQKNARTAVEVALRRGYAPADIAKALAPIVRELPDRRFQIAWPPHGCGTCEADGPVVITDYAHHPTEMKCAIDMARRVCRGRLRVLFQPHRYSRTKALAADFPAALAGADEVVLCPTYAAFEKPEEGGDIADLYASCRSAFTDGPVLYLARTCEEAWRHAFIESRPGDATLLLGAGDIIDLLPRVAADMSAKRGYPGDGASLSGYSFFRTGGRTVGGGARRVVGMGSNLWISDLATDEEYVRLQSAPAGMPGARLGVPWMAGIPGTVGGWIKMNAGAFGHSIGEIVRRVKVDGCWLDRDECGFGYRKSSITGTIEDAEFDPVVDSQTAADYLARRRDFPPRCCGSVFKNPPGGFAGRLLEEAGAKGLSVGGAYVWEGHANVIAVRDGGTSSDILALARIMRERVRHRFGVRLEPEIVGLGEGMED